jgi:hypothetical protein
MEGENKRIMMKGEGDEWEVHSDLGMVYMLIDYDGVNSKGEHSRMFKFDLSNKQSE